MELPMIPKAQMQRRGLLVEKVRTRMKHTRFWTNFWVLHLLEQSKQFKFQFLRTKVLICFSSYNNHRIYVRTNCFSGIYSLNGFLNVNYVIHGLRDIFLSWYQLTSQKFQILKQNNYERIINIKNIKNYKRVANLFLRVAMFLWIQFQILIVPQ